jgi:predicted nucleotidyltransferase
MTYHYLSMAKSQFKSAIEGREQAPLKKYLYVIRPLVCIRWMEQNGSPPPTSIWDTIGGIEIEQTVRSVVTDLLERKRAAGELGAAPLIAMLDDFYRTESERIMGIVGGFPDERMESSELDALAWRELGC